MAAVSTISTMKVERPRARLLVYGADAAGTTGDMSIWARAAEPVARLRQNGDQRVLAQKGRFAGHVRPGQQPDRWRLALVRAQSLDEGLPCA